MPYRPKLKEQMDYCMAHPDELTKVAAVQKRVPSLSMKLERMPCFSPHYNYECRMAIGNLNEFPLRIPEHGLQYMIQASCSISCYVCLLLSVHADRYFSYLQVDEVKNIMVDNIEKVLERGEKIELLVDKSENLRDRVSTESGMQVIRYLLDQD